MGTPALLPNPAASAIVTPGPGPQQTPEPTTILAWGLVAGVAGLRVRRRLRVSARS